MLICCHFPNVRLEVALSSPLESKGRALLPRSVPVQRWQAHVLAPSAQEYLVDEAVQGYGTEHFFGCLDDDQRGPGASHQGGDLQRRSIGTDDGQFMFLRGQALLHGAVGQFVQECVGVFFVYHPGERWVVDAVMGNGHPQHLRARKNGHWSALAIYHDQSWQVAASQELQGFQRRGVQADGWEWSRELSCTHRSSTGDGRTARMRYPSLQLSPRRL